MNIKIIKEIEEVSIVEDKERDCFNIWNDTWNYQFTDDDGNPLRFETQHAAMDYLKETAEGIIVDGNLVG